MATNNMSQRVARFFEPVVVLHWRGRFGTLGPAFYADTLADQRLLQQFLDEAGHSRGRPRVLPRHYDAVLAVAGRYGYSIETNISEEFYDEATVQS